MDETGYSCNDCHYAKNLYINNILDAPSKTSDKNFETVKGGHDEYFYKFWCWCSHPEHNGPEFHRMKMRYISRDECVPLLKLFEGILNEHN